MKKKPESIDKMQFLYMSGGRRVCTGRGKTFEKQHGKSGQNSLTKCRNIYKCKVQCKKSFGRAQLTGFEMNFRKIKQMNKTD